ncbi:hypothetical protein MLD38_020527 [Melastoma candidum]|uniref:Uncharacterized protein n=1 Tax=Melastoma candidum TaxID=119954 RepID=A0ACB9QEF3_9MYRT|nr:hypothetical protein MLD38_020527 [Melastoma candidum]
MSASDAGLPPPAPDAAAPAYTYRKEIVSSKIAELNESRSELQTRIQSLKQDLQSWRSKLDTQVKIYHDELSQLKTSLNVEVEQLRSEFQELRTTLQQQQEDVAASLRNLGLQEAPSDDNMVKGVKIEGEKNEALKDNTMPSYADDVKPQL